MRYLVACALIVTTLSASAPPFDTHSRLVYWNRIANDASALDHTPSAPGDPRIAGEQAGPGRQSRAIAIVHIAMFDAVNAITSEWNSYTNIASAPPGASVDAAIAQAAHDTLANLFPSQSRTFRHALHNDLARLRLRGLLAGRSAGHRAASAILALRRNDGSQHNEPRLGIDYFTSDLPGHWRQDPVSRIPVALGAYWGNVTPFVIASGNAFRAPPPPALTSPAYTNAFNDVKRLGGDGLTTPTERTNDQTQAGIFWAYDGTPGLGAPPRLYNQITMVIADQMGSDAFQLLRLLTLVNVAMADACIAVWESKYYYDLWRPVTGIREADTDGNSATTRDPSFLPLGAPASNSAAPDFTPPFPAYPSGHAGLGGALFEVLRRFYQTDAIAFTVTSDEYNGTTTGHGVPRSLHPRSFATLSQAEEENGQSRIYLGIHWAFDKTSGITQGHRVARYVLNHAFGVRQ